MTNLYPTEYIDLESTCRAHFGAALQIQRIVARNIPTGKSSYTSVFESTKGETYALCVADTPLTLADVKRIIRGAGMEAETFFPPSNNPNYFLQYGQQAFLAAFPGRKLNASDDLSFYTSLAPYMPALVKVAQVKGELRQYVPVIGKWYKLLNYSYNRIEVQQ